MNVSREFTDVSTTVATRMVPMRVAVLLAIDLTVMATLAMVLKSLCAQIIIIIMSLLNRHQ